MSILFSPITIRDINIRNRVTMSPMCQYSARDGFAGEWHPVHYGARASGGTGLIIFEATAVWPEGRITPGDLGLWSDDQIPALRRITDFIHNQGAVAGIQLAHAGRKASCALPWEGGKQLDLNNGGWQTVAPSDIPFKPGERAPIMADRVCLERIVEGFRDAAVRALKAGFKVVEIHAAHGYLLQEFLSPISNKRTDDYGGSFENRTRLLLQVTGAVRSVWPEELPLFVRISSTEWTEGGWTPEESVRLAPLLHDAGADLIDCSSGGNIYNAKIPASPGYQVPFAAAVKQTGILTGAVGQITDAGQAEKILSDRSADLILMGRELLRNPYFPLQAAQQLGTDIPWPLQYQRSKQ
ncbi:MAG: NADH:flavin oxidoreductase/NADH oxidase [Bacteroidales bacterium]|nr:NADH:flavin oxidoreductase/NADH oxidase [Bacteroidales bacterium]